jgi:hypothetical protein
MAAGNEIGIQEGNSIFIVTLRPGVGLTDVDDSLLPHPTVELLASDHAPIDQAGNAAHGNAPGRDFRGARTKAVEQ